MISLNRSNYTGDPSTSTLGMLLAIVSGSVRGDNQLRECDGFE